MRITNWKHFPWFVFVCLATIAACLLYVGNFHPERMPAGIRLPPSLIQTPTEHHTVGGTPLGLAFGAISLAIFVFAALLSLRKKIPLWRVGTVQRWLRAHIWLTFLTIPLVILHSGFRLGGPMTTLLMVLYAIVMVSGIYGLVLQHLMPRLMKERLPAETVFEQIPHIRAQLCVAAEKMRDSFKPAPPKKPDAGAPAPSRGQSGDRRLRGDGFDERRTEHSGRSREISDWLRCDGGSRLRAAATTLRDSNRREPSNQRPIPSATQCRRTASDVEGRDNRHADSAECKANHLARRLPAQSVPAGDEPAPVASSCSGCAAAAAEKPAESRVTRSAQPKPASSPPRRNRLPAKPPPAAQTRAPTRSGIGGGAGRIHRSPDSSLPSGETRRTISPGQCAFFRRHVSIR